MKIIAGIEVYLTTNHKQADEYIKKIQICRNCSNYHENSLFNGTCSVCGGYDYVFDPFKVDFDDSCECFCAREKIVEYWLQKLVQIHMDYSGSSNECRIFFNHFNNKL